MVLIIGQKTVSTPDRKTLSTGLSHTLKVLGLLFRKEAHKLQNAGKESFRSFASNQVGNSAFSFGRMEAADSLRSTLLSFMALAMTSSLLLVALASPTDNRNLLRNHSCMRTNLVAERLLHWKEDSSEK